MSDGFSGADGCRGGWFFVQLNATGAWKTALAQNSETLAELIENSKLTLIDIPIGLLESGGPHRECDQPARKALSKPRAASVFAVPSRPAVYATTYAQSCALNFRSLGKKLSKQTWNIVDKIRQIDELLSDNHNLRDKLRECHPEVGFWALNNKTAMKFSKKNAAGRQERLRLLSRHLAPARDIFNHSVQTYRRKDVAVDDIIDAMALAITARQGYKNLLSFPRNSDRMDARGLRMEIVFWDYEA